MIEITITADVTISPHRTHVRARRGVGRVGQLWEASRLTSSRVLPRSAAMGTPRVIGASGVETGRSDRFER